MSTHRESEPDVDRVGAPAAYGRPISDVSIEEIEHLVARGEQLRAAYVAQAGRRFWLTLSSVWRRRGRLNDLQGARARAAG